MNNKTAYRQKKEKKLVSEKLFFKNLLCLMGKLIKCVTVDSLIFKLCVLKWTLFEIPSEFYIK